MNKERQQIFDKSDGHCWYCGCNLGKKWHKDHVIPVYRRYGEIEKPELDTIDNLVPSCPPCNLFKGVFSIEEFRQEIQLQVDRCRKSSVNFRTAERFGLIKIVEKPVVFWFEENKK